MEQINNLEDLSAYFYGLADGSIEPFNRMYGICHQVDCLFEREVIAEDVAEGYYCEVLFMDRYFQSWEYFSGHLAYPVPSANKVLTPEEMFDSVVDKYGDMWVGEYGDLRRDLCHHIAKEIEKLIPVG